MPSVLVETGFLTNASEGSYLNSRKGQLNMANAIAKAIINYKKNRAASFEIDAITSTTISKSISKENQSEVYFKIQIAASKKKLDLKPFNFKGLKNLSRSKSGKLYRYYFGKSSTLEKAKKKLKAAKNKGYSKAFIVAFDGEIKISVSEALDRLK